MGKTVTAPATPKPKVNAPPSGSSSLSSLSDIEDPPSLASPTKSTPEKKISASKDADGHDPEGGDADPEEIATALSRPTPGQQLVSATAMEGQTRVYLSLHISSDLQSSRLFFPHL